MLRLLYSRAAVIYPRVGTWFVARIYPSSLVRGIRQSFTPGYVCVVLVKGVTCDAAKLGDVTVQWCAGQDQSGGDGSSDCSGVPDIASRVRQVTGDHTHQYADQRMKKTPFSRCL